MRGEEHRRLGRAEDEDHHRRRAHVRDPLTGQPDHRHRVGPDRREQHQHRDGGGPRRQPPSGRDAREATVGVEEAEALGEQEHRQVVEDRRPRRHVAEAQGVQGHDDGDEAGESEYRVAPVQAPLDGRGQHHEHVDGEEPQRLGGDAGHVGCQSRLVPHRDEDRAGDEPDRREDHGGSQEPLGPGGEERAGVASAVGLQRPQVGEAPDHEEHRHDLEQPGQPLEPGQRGEGVGAPQATVALADDGGDEPVPGDDGEDARRPQEVDDPIPVGRRRHDEVAEARPVSATVHGRPPGQPSWRSASMSSYSRISWVCTSAMTSAMRRTRGSSAWRAAYSAMLTPPW